MPCPSALSAAHGERRHCVRTIAPRPAVRSGLTAVRLPAPGGTEATLLYLFARTTAYGRTDFQRTTSSSSYYSRLPPVAAKSLAGCHRRRLSEGAAVNWRRPHAIPDY